MSTVEATIRNTNTKGEINSLRIKGDVPAIIYGGSEENKKISLSKKKYKKSYRKRKFFIKYNFLKCRWKIGKCTAQRNCMGSNYR